MKRCIPYLLAFQQVLCGLWIMIVFVQAFLPGTLFLPGCVLFFILQWGLSLLSHQKKPALRSGFYFLNIILFAFGLPIQKNILTLVLTAVGLDSGNRPDPDAGRFAGLFMGKVGDRRADSDSRQYGQRRPESDPQLAATGFGGVMPSHPVSVFQPF